jgi:hypothetical protein
MPTISVSVAPEGDEDESACSCCGRPIYWGFGWLESEGRSLAAYWYQWSEGHEARFRLAIARFDERENLVPGVACVGGHIENEAICYSILEANESPWADFGRFGAASPRSAALEDKQHIFELVDAIAANEKRISSRILGCGLQA